VVTCAFSLWLKASSELKLFLLLLEAPPQTNIISLGGNLIGAPNGLMYESDIKRSSENSRLVSIDRVGGDVSMLGKVGGDVSMLGKVGGDVSMLGRAYDGKLFDETFTSDKASNGRTFEDMSIIKYV